MNGDANIWSTTDFTVTASLKHEMNSSKAVALVKRGLRHPFSHVVILQVLLLVVLNASDLGPERSATRQVVSMIVIATLMLAAPGAPRALVRAGAFRPRVIRL